MVKNVISFLILLSIIPIAAAQMRSLTTVLESEVGGKVAKNARETFEKALKERSAEQAKRKQDRGNTDVP